MSYHIWGSDLFTFFLFFFIIEKKTNWRFTERCEGRTRVMSSLWNFLTWKLKVQGDEKLATYVIFMCRNDELSSTMSWVSCLLKDSELLISFAEKSQILLKKSVIPILLTFIYRLALNLLLNNWLNSLFNSAHHCNT